MNQQVAAPRPAVLFKMVKRHTDTETKNVTEAVHDTRIFVDGCHGHTDNLNELLKRGLKCIGYENLRKQDGHIKAWVDAHSGSLEHPLLKDESVITAKLKVANERKG